MHTTKPIPYNLRILWASSTLLQINFITSADILCTNFNEFNNPPLFFINALLMFSNSQEMIRQIATCHSYDKLCVKNIILTLMHFLVLLCELSINAQT